MALMTGEEYLESMRKLNMQIYMFGEKVENFVDNPILRPSLNSVKATYDLAQMPEYEDLMTTTSSLTGKKINRFTHLHQSTDDLIKKVKMQRLCGQKTAACFQRCVTKLVRWTLSMQHSAQLMKLMSSMAHTTMIILRNSLNTYRIMI